MTFVKATIVQICACVLILAGTNSYSFAATAPKELIQTAVEDYMAGHVLDAEKKLLPRLSSNEPVEDRWAMADVLSDLCTYAYDYTCIDAIIKPMQDIADQLHKPEITAPKIAFVALFDSYLHNNMDWFKDGHLDFAEKIATPLRNPVLSTRTFLLNAAVLQDIGDFSGAHREIDRAFANYLQVDPSTNSFESATLLKSLIAAAVMNHDAARAIRWADAGEPLIVAGLRKSSFDYADFLAVRVQLYELLAPTADVTVQAIDEASSSMKALQITPYLQAANLTTLAVNRAAIFALRQDAVTMQKTIQSAPFYSTRSEIIRRGTFVTPIELMYATAEIFFDDLAGKTPDQKWGPLISNLPKWTLANDAAGETQIFDQMAIALLKIKADRAGASQIVKDAARAELVQFEKGRKDTRAFALPSLLDRVIFTTAADAISAQPSGSDGDLLLGEMELVNRNPRYVIPDDKTLPMVAFIDLDETGNPQGMVFSNKRDGRWDVSYWDTKGSGHWDTMGHHPDGKIIPSSYEPYTEK